MNTFGKRVLSTLRSAKIEAGIYYPAHTEPRLRLDDIWLASYPDPDGSR